MRLIFCWKNCGRILRKIKLPKKEDIQTSVLTWKWLNGLIAWSKHHSLPGFFKVPVYDVTVFVYKEAQRQDLFSKANSVAFSFFLSLFPSLMSLFTLLPFLRQYLFNYLPEQGANFDATLKSEIHGLMPGNAGDQIITFIEDLTTNPRVGLLSFGFLLAIFFASNGMLAMMNSFEKAVERSFKKRKSLRKRGIAIFLTSQLGFLLIASVLLIIVGNFLIEWLAHLIGLDRFFQWTLYAMRWVIILMLLYTVISLIYRYGVPTRRKFRMFSPGATLATVLSILSSVAFSFYVDRFSQYNKLYGSFGTIIVTMLWIQINALVLLLGFELNAAIAINRDIRADFNSNEEVK